MLPYGDSPYDHENVGEEVYVHILNHAKKYVHIMTPYLILDNGMLDTLTRAAKSGIEVCIIMPHIPDKWYAFAVAKTYYRELIEAGVNIYEFTPGFVHAKVFVSDDDLAGYRIYSGALSHRCHRRPHLCRRHLFCIDGSIEGNDRASYSFFATEIQIVTYFNYNNIINE